ncbi:MAG: hypothetical protein ACTHLN_04895 [Tepidisphaeraceae bacterium]
MLAVVPYAVARGARWVCAPLRIKRTQSLAIRIERVPTTLEHLTPQMRTFIGENTAVLGEAGFRVVASHYLPNAVPNVTAVEVLLTNGERREYAKLLAVTAKTTRTLVAYVCTDLSSGDRWVTCSSSQATILPPEPMTHALMIAGVRDVGALLEFHRRRLADAGATEIGDRVLPAAGDEIGFLEQSDERSARWAEQIGYRYRDEAAGVWRYTLRGAYLCTWRMLEPVKSYRLQKRQRLARAEWTRLGMDDEAAARAEPRATMPIR